MEHLRQAATKIAGMTLEIKPQPNEDAHPVKIGRNGTGMKAAALVVTELYNRKPVFVRGGGTIGALSMIDHILGLETTMFAFAESDNMAHSADEFARLKSFRYGERAYVRLLHELSLLHPYSDNQKDVCEKEEL